MSHHSIHIPVLAMCLCLASPAAHAEGDKLTVKPSGRILMDGAVMGSDDDDMDQKAEGGFAVPDVRVGVSATYGKWKAKIDVGYSHQTLSMKDVFLEYDINGENLVRAGYFIHQFSYQSCTSSSFKVAMESPATNCLSNDQRMLGVMFEHYDDKYLAALSLYTDNQSMKKATNETGFQGCGVMTRLVYHPKIQRGNMLHVGVGVSYDKASKNNSNMKWTAAYPTRVADLNVIGTHLADAKGAVKAQAEFMASRRHLALEAQASYMNAQRTGGAPSYNAWGAYGNLRFLFNNEYTYTKVDGGIATPDPKSWEAVLSYNHTDMNDGDIRGGRVNDWALTMNYYINKYMIWRVSSHLVGAGSNNSTLTATPNANTFWVVETRLQFKI